MLPILYLLNNSNKAVMNQFQFHLPITTVKNKINDWRPVKEEL